MNRRTFMSSLASPWALGCAAGAAPAGVLVPPEGVGSSPAGRPPDRDLAVAAMKHAARYLLEHVSHRGGYVWSYLPDLSRCWGELEARRTMLWVQPPGTPSVGQLWIDAFHATGDPFYLDAAFQTARALIAAQHASGGWSYVHDFAGRASLHEWYASYGRNAWRMEEFHVARDNATFDDACTASATQFLLRLELARSSPEVSSALDRALRFVLDSQYDCGGWPQRFPLDDDYTRLITFNDHVIGENLKTLLMAYVALGRADVLEPLRAGMQCVLAMQQPTPQPGWGLQHELDGSPAAGRSFEPAALATHTTAANIELLATFHELTGEDEYLRRVPEALDWLDAVRLPSDSGHARGGTHPTFIERGSGDPLYVHRRGSNAFNGRYFVDQVFEPRLSHYSPVRRIDVARLRRMLGERRAAPRAPLLPKRAGSRRLPRYYSLGEPTLQALCGGSPLQPAVVSAEAALRIVRELDGEGRWLAPLPLVSNPYRGPGSAAPYTGAVYASTSVGDRSDTSPFAPDARPSTYGEQAPVHGISIEHFIRNMSTLLAFVSPEPLEAPSGSPRR